MSNVTPYLETPLHYFKETFMQEEARNTAGISLEEKMQLCFFILRADKTDSQFCADIKKIMQLDLPTKPRSVSQSNIASLFWLSPDEWLLVLDNKKSDAIISALKATLSGHYALVDNSGGLTCLSLKGEKVPLLLQKSCAYDFSAHHFSVGQCVQTKFAKAQALIFKSDYDTFELYIRRSFADYVAAWCIDAAKEYA